MFSFVPTGQFWHESLSGSMIYCPSLQGAQYHVLLPLPLTDSTRTCDLPQGEQRILTALLITWALTDCDEYNPNKMVIFGLSSAHVTLWLSGSELLIPDAESKGTKKVGPRLCSIPHAAEAHSQDSNMNGSRTFAVPFTI